MATTTEAWATAVEALVACAMAMSLDVAAFTDSAIAVDMEAMAMAATILFWGAGGYGFLACITILHESNILFP